MPLPTGFAACEGVRFAPFTKTVATFATPVAAR